MDERPKRRWLAFSLRTFFIALTVVAIWFGWNLQLVRQREATLKYLQKIPSTFPVVTVATEVGQIRPWRRLPILWQWLGAQPVRDIHLRKINATDDDLRRLEELFPDASIFVIE